MSEAMNGVSFPLDPLKFAGASFDEASRRRSVEGVLDSYHSNYDVPCEAIQNAVDAVEDAKLLDLGGPYRIDVTVNFQENWISFLDTGIGMSVEEVARAFAPHVSFKAESRAQKKRSDNNMYRGFKGIGLTFLAYGTDDITLHSKKEGKLTMARMRYGRAWATGRRADSAQLIQEHEQSPLERCERGTFIKIVFSAHTRPRSLKQLASTVEIWKTILRTKTAVGQIIYPQDDDVVPIEVQLTTIDSDSCESENVESVFLFPHEIRRNPRFRFLNLVEYHQKHEEMAEPPSEMKRQDGVYLWWDTSRINRELTSNQKEEHESQLQRYSPCLYAFVPYQGSVWGELNYISTRHGRRKYLYPGLMVAVNRQRLADIFEIEPTRFETFSRNIYVAVHFQGAKPDHGRKTIDEEAMQFAKNIADRVVQYLAKQRSLLRPPGESPTPGQRQVEKDHAEWVFNVKLHQRRGPLHIPPVSYLSTPLTEQDVVGLFHQFSALGVFAGAKVYSTSQSQTYDCLIKYDCSRGTPGLAYEDNQPLGVSPFTLGEENLHFETRELTVEFKNNLDGLIDDIDGDRSPKQFENIDICVCWGTVSNSFKGYELLAITEANIDSRKFPGVTHVLNRDGSSSPMSIVMLSSVIKMIENGMVVIPVA